MDHVISISARRCALGLATIVAVIVVASVVASFLSFVPISDSFLRGVRNSLVRLTSVDGEGNIPAWYSAVLLLLCALLLGTIALAHRSRAGRRLGGWLLLTLIFFFLSLDEIAQLHELSIVPLQNRFDTTGFFHFAWIIPATVCVVIFVLGYLRFLARLPARTRHLFLLAGAVYVGGALGIEAISGKQASLHGERNPVYHAIVTVEELFEMVGITIFLYALLDYIAREFSTLTFHVTSDT